MKSINWTRKSAVAGRFYPEEEKTLRHDLEQFLNPKESTTKKPHGIIVPHAGYIYSGQTAAEVYRRIQLPSTVILLCPNHTGSGSRISVWSEGSWETPLGQVSIDEKFSQALLAKWKISGDRKAHVYEHAIEVQIPFLQMLHPSVRIVPIVLGPLSLEECLALGKSLSEVVKSQGADDILLISSTDMSHYISDDLARKKDALALKAVGDLDPEALYQTVIEEDISMCGFIPTTVVLEAAKRLGAQQGGHVAYSTSGEVTGDKKSVVGYASAILL